VIAAALIAIALLMLGGVGALARIADTLEEIRDLWKVPSDGS
jgi:hypothetical protein